MTWDAAEVAREALGRVGNMCQRVSPVTALSVFLHSQPWAPGGPAGLKPLLLWPRPRLSLSLSLSPAPIWKILPAPPSAFNHVTALLGPFHGGLSLGMRWLTLKAGLKVRTREPSSGLSGMFRGSPLPASRTPLPRLLPVCPCVLPA